MAEQFKKRYIPASEFVKAWDKEIYELSNLDYFIYLLMNSLADAFEQKFFPGQHDADEEFLLDKNEIISLAFFIGDSVQLFFEKHCFGMCGLNCPAEPDKKLTSDEILSLGDIAKSGDIANHSCSTKEECLRYDLINYVLIDAVVEFYHFDLRVTAGEDDVFLQDLIRFINDHIVTLIHKEGHVLLANPQENASALFENLLASEDANWEEFDSWDEDDFDPEAPDEPWKLPSADLVTAIDEFKSLQSVSTLTEPKTLDLFANFMTTYIGALSVEELTRDDLEEFLTVVLPTELADESQIDFKEEMRNFKSFLTYLDYQYETHLVQALDELQKDETFADLLRTVTMTQQYHRTHSYVEFQISPERNDPSLIEGFFEITNRRGTRYQVEDIHLNDTYWVDFSALNSDDIHAGDIFNMSLVAESNGWRTAWIECVFPGKAKFYLL